MALLFKQRFLASLKDGIKRNQITIINSSVAVILIGIVIFFLLSRSSALHSDTAEENMLDLAKQTANVVQSYYSSYFDIARNFSTTIYGYTNFDPAMRRSYINETMLEIISSNKIILNIYSLWKPNELDGLDSLYTNTADADENGQFLSGYTREEGWIEHRLYKEFKYILESGNLPSSSVITSDPMVFNKPGRFRNTWIVDIRVPIIENENVIGVVGFSVSLDWLQYQIELIRPYKTGYAMVCTRNGTIVAHMNQRMRGTTANDAYQAIRDAIDSREYTIHKTSETLIVCYPLRRGPEEVSEIIVDSNWAVIIAVPLQTIFSPLKNMLFYSVLFIISAAVIIVFVVLGTSRSLTQQAKALQHDLERASAMQDNLKYGLFLMDNKFIVQGAYSRALEKILSISALRGKNFIELLTSSLETAERDRLVDYFNILFKKTYDDKMFVSINPIAEFKYICINTKEAKNLRAGFSLVSRGKNDFILGTLEDITAEKELKMQLLEAENIREIEMRSIFQVIQMDPRVLSNFIDDAEHEFARINKMLRIKKHLHKDLLVELYQFVHSVKSDAVILNLENFSERLQKLESSIKSLQEKPGDIFGFSDFLDLFLETDKTIIEIGRLKNAVFIIENLRSVLETGRSQEQDVFIETLNLVCNKIQFDQNKKARLVVEKMDAAVLKYGPRREIKEILTQLIRNAVYHGIETLDARMSSGKDPEGEIRLSIEHRNNMVFIEFADDGSGIDFNKILKKAVANKMIKNEADAKDKNYLLKTIFLPGFSTIGTADFIAGRGIGLSLIKDRVKNLNGNIKISTALGKGTTFFISIPMELQMPVDKVS